MITKIELPDLSQFSFENVAETEGMQNVVVKYDRFAGEVFKIGFVAKRTNPGPGEPVFYPVWVATLSAVTVARQMLGNEIVEFLYGRPDTVFFAGVSLAGSATNVLAHRAPEITAA